MANVTQLAEFDEIVDVRTPREYAEDHVPGAMSRPVLSDEERARVGTLYKQVSAFSGRKLGAALVSRNIGQHIETNFMDKPRAWRPLVYCWRGGQRSAAMVHVLREIGWDAQQLEGGYRAYRRTVAAELPLLARRYRFHVVCGLTGSGKTLLLQALHGLGAQVLDLEQLAAHRGSVLGDVPGRPQPSQKMFESGIWGTLRRLDPERRVFLEAESTRIGALQVRDDRAAARRGSECIWVDCDMAARVQHLKREYAHFLTDAASLSEQLDRLTPLHGRAVIERWKELGQRREWDELVRELLERHYDPAYTRSIASHYSRLPLACKICIDGPLDANVKPAALALLHDSYAPAG